MVMEKPAWRGARAAPLAIFLIALTVRLSIAVGTHAYQPPAYGESVCVALTVAGQGVFGNPFNGETGPTAHVAPIYPYFLALVLKAAPWGPAFNWAVILLGAFSAALSWCLLPACGVRLGLDYRVGVLGGLYGAIYPFRHAIELQGQWEASFAGIAFMGLTIVTLRRPYSQSDGRALGWGALWGAAMLLQPAFLPVFFAFLVFGWIGSERRAATLRRAAVALAGMALAISPWIVRNYRQLGGVTFVRDNFGLELSISNNPNALPNIHENLHMNKNSDHPDTSLVEKRKVAEMGELAYNRLRLHAALAWIAGHPARFLQLTAQRAGYFWAPQRRWFFLTALDGLFSLVALLGLWTMLRRREKAARMFALIWLTYPPVYYFIQADERYRLPMEWCITLCASYCISEMWRIYRRHSRVGSTGGKPGFTAAGA